MIHTWTGYQLHCDHAGCATKVPDREVSAWSDVADCFTEATESGWVTLNGEFGDRWICFEHWTVNDDDEIVEVP